MRRDPQRFKIGVFTVVGVLLLLTAVIAVGAGRWWLREGRTVYCYFTESVSGISNGSPLKLRGVEVGHVADVVLLPPGELRRGVSKWDTVIEVQCTVYPDALGVDAGLVTTEADLERWVQLQVARGMRVTIKWKDITGQKYLSLDHFRISDHPIPDLPTTRRPYIPTAQQASFSDIQRDLAATLAKIAQMDFQEISHRVLDVLDIAAQRIEAIDTVSLQGHAEETLVAVRELAQDPALRRVLDRLDTISESMTTTTKRVEELLAGDRIDDGLDDVRESAAALRRTMARLEEDIPRLVGRVEEVAQRAARVVDEADVSGTTASIRGAADSFAGAADRVGDATRDIAAMRQELRRVMREVSSTSRAVGRLARSLEEQPGSLLAGKRVRAED